MRKKGIAILTVLTVILQCIFGIPFSNNSDSSLVSVVSAADFSTAISAEEAGLTAKSDSILLNDNVLQASDPTNPSDPSNPTDPSVPTDPDDDDEPEDESEDESETDELTPPGVDEVLPPGDDIDTSSQIEDNPGTSVASVESVVLLAAGALAVAVISGKKRRK